mmetsp:Transcript_18220/g.72999  ORF Transcript_18220/g.72999 Transcript_18220/m.72999 type:complete len:87 (-) Transcript_18220:3417-3677(-)
MRQGSIERGRGQLCNASSHFASFATFRQPGGGGWSNVWVSIPSTQDCWLRAELRIARVFGFLKEQEGRGRGTRTQQTAPDLSGSQK